MKTNGRRGMSTGFRLHARTCLRHRTYDACWLLMLQRLNRLSAAVADSLSPQHAPARPMACRPPGLSGAVVSFHLRRGTLWCLEGMSIAPFRNFFFFFYFLSRGQQLLEPNAILHDIVPVSQLRTGSVRSVQWCRPSTSSEVFLSAVPSPEWHMHGIHQWHRVIQCRSPAYLLSKLYLTGS